MSLMPEIVDPSDDNAAMRTRTGEVDDDRRLVAFLYLVARDHVVPGALEELLENLARADGPFEFTNGHLARYAQDVAARLTDRGAADDLVATVREADDVRDRVVETAVSRARRDKVPVFIRPAVAPEHMLRIRCNLCGAGNPDARRLLDEEHGERQHCFNCRTVLEALPESLPDDLPEPAGPDEEPCGAVDRSGRLVCTLSASHRDHDYRDVDEGDEVHQDACGETDDEGRVCVKPDKHDVHGSEGAL